MEKLTGSALKTILEETDRAWISDYLNADEEHEAFLVGNIARCSYSCRVILEEEVKLPRVRILLLVFPKYCNDRTADDFFIDEYTARKENEPNHSANPKEYPYEYRYTYARLKSIESALSHKFKAFHEMIEEMADTDVEAFEFRKDFQTKKVEQELGLIQFEKDNKKYDYCPTVAFSHMRYRFCLLYKTIEKKSWKESVVTSCLLFIPCDIWEKEPLEGYNSYIVYLKSDRTKDDDEYRYSNSIILDMEDAEYPADEKIIEKVAAMRKEMFD